MVDIFAKTHQCRRCINQKYCLRLQQRDCIYWQFPVRCDTCGEIRNIVTGIRTLSKWKLWFKKVDK